MVICVEFNVYILINRCCIDVCSAKCGTIIKCNNILRGNLKSLNTTAAETTEVSLLTLIGGEGSFCVFALCKILQEFLIT